MVEKEEKSEICTRKGDMERGGGEFWLPMTRHPRKKSSSIGETGLAIGEGSELRVRMYSRCPTGWESPHLGKEIRTWMWQRPLSLLPTCSENTQLLTSCLEEKQATIPVE